MSTDPSPFAIDPFGPSANPAAYVALSGCERARAAMEAALDAGRVAALVGPPGHGKTTLLRMIGGREQERGRVAYVPFSTLLPDDLYAMVLNELRATRNGVAPREKLLGILREMAPQGGLAVLIDDAHALPVETARALAQLTAEADGALRLAITAVASPEADDVCRAFGDAISVVELDQGLTPDETHTYVETRLAYARARPDLVAAFDDETIGELHQQSQGVPRKLNQVAEALVRRVAPDAMPRLRDLTEGPNAPQPTAPPVRDAAPASPPPPVRDVAPQPTAPPVRDAAPASPPPPVRDVAPQPTAPPVRDAAPASAEPSRPRIAVVPDVADTAEAQSDPLATAEVSKPEGVEAGARSEAPAVIALAGEEPPSSAAPAAEGWRPAQPAVADPVGREAGLASSRDEPSATEAVPAVGEVAAEQSVPSAASRAVDNEATAAPPNAPERVEPLEADTPARTSRLVSIARERARETTEPVDEPSILIENPVAPDLDLDADLELEDADLEATPELETDADFDAGFEGGPSTGPEAEPKPATRPERPRWSAPEDHPPPMLAGRVIADPFPPELPPRRRPPVPSRPKDELTELPTPGESGAYRYAKSPGPEPEIEPTAEAPEVPAVEIAVDDPREAAAVEQLSALADAAQPPHVRQPDLTEIVEPFPPLPGEIRDRETGDRGAFGTAFHWLRYPALALAVSLALAWLQTRDAPQPLPMPDPPTPSVERVALPTSPPSGAEFRPPPASATVVPVAINATPWAIIEIDGRELGETPLAGVEIEVGPHSFRAHMPDGTVRERMVYISPENRTLVFE